MGYYDSIAQGYDELHGEEQGKKLELIKKNISIHPDYKILDIGCGTGISSDFNCKVIGVDPSAGLLNVNKSRMKVAGVAENLPFRDCSFDGIVSVTAVHNFHSFEKALDEMKRVCKSFIIISVLKKAKNFKLIAASIRKTFKITKEINEGTDHILFGKKS